MALNNLLLAIVIIVLVGLVIYFAYNSITINSKISSLSSNLSAQTSKYNELNNTYHNLSSKFASLNTTAVVLYKKNYSFNITLAKENITEVKTTGDYYNKSRGQIVYGNYTFNETKPSMYNTTLNIPYLGYIKIDMVALKNVNISRTYISLLNKNTTNLLYTPQNYYLSSPPITYNPGQGPLLIPVLPGELSISVNNYNNASISAIITINYTGTER